MTFDVDWIAANSPRAVAGWVALMTISAVIILTGLVVILGRYWLANKKLTGQLSRGPGEPSDSDGTLVRGSIAISLVSGLLVFCAVALSTANTSLQNTLFGGLVTSVGTAVAFYFSSKSAEQARNEILKATQPTTEVPSRQGMTVTDARAEMAKTPLRIVMSSPSALPSDQVIHQSPSPGAAVPSGSNVNVET